MRKMMRRELQARQSGLASRTVRGRNNKKGLRRATVTNSITGLVTVLDTEEALNLAAANSNRRPQQQCEQTPFMQEPLLSLVGHLADGPAVKSILDGTFVPPAGLNPYTVELLEGL